MTKKKILVVEDDTPILEMLNWTLTDAGYEVLLAADGETALKFATESAPDLILLDLMMPRMNGWEVIGRLRAIPNRQAIPVIVVSADRAVADRAREIKAVGYIAKPFELDELESTLVQYLGSP